MISSSFFIMYTEVGVQLVGDSFRPVMTDNEICGPFPPEILNSLSLLSMNPFATYLLPYVSQHCGSAPRAICIYILLMQFYLNHTFQSYQIAFMPNPGSFTSQCATLPRNSSFQRYISNQPS